MSFTASQKMLIRKYAGYPAFGGLASPSFGWRFFTEYGDLEFRINNLAPDEETEVIVNFLPKLAQLETDIYDVRQNSDTTQAAVWYRNKKELAERTDNYREWRIRLCDFLGVAYGPRLLNKTQLRVVV